MIELRTSPHVRGALTLPKIMRHVVYALLPICIFSIYQFGLSALVLLLVVSLSCVLTEFLFNKQANKANTINDFSAGLNRL